MKLRFTLLFILIASFLFGQDNNVKKQLTAKREIIDCELITLNAIDLLSEQLLSNNRDTFKLIVNEWTKSCGESECAQRLLIIDAIRNNEPSLELIQNYLNNGYHYNWTSRLYNSKKSNYAYIYSNKALYYEFVPLRHRIDSVCISLSKKILEQDSLTSDEKLICIKFSGEMEESNKEINKKEYNDSYIKQYVIKENFQYYNSGIGYSFYTGIYRPIGTNNIFNNSPILGFTFSSPLAYKFIVELGVKFRININDNDFLFYAFGDTNTVNSDVGVFFGGYFGYKIYEKDKIIILPKFGIGVESVSTGLSKKENNSEETNYYNVETVHLSLGVSVMRQIFKRNYIGLEITYHYCPYQTVKSLYTEFNNNSLSAEVSFRF